MISSLFCLDHQENGMVLLEKHTSHHKVPRRVCELFWAHVSSPNNSQVPSILSLHRFQVISLFHKDSHDSGIWLITALQEETNAVLALETLQNIAQTLEYYLGNAFTASQLSQNLTITHLLLDEMFDSGFAFTTELSQLSELVPRDSFTSRIARNVVGSTGNSSRTLEKLPKTISSSLPWRKTDCKYLSDSFNVLVDENLHAVVSPNGSLVSSSVSGTLQCTSRLSGVPDVSFSLPVAPENVSVHRCVRLGKLKTERLLSFIPPDGVFELARYLLPGPAFLPLSLKTEICFKAPVGNIMIRVMSSHQNSDQLRKPLGNFRLSFSLPSECSSACLSASHGTVRYEPTLQLVEWNIPNLPAKGFPELKGTIHLSQEYNSLARPVITALFSIDDWTPSHVRIERINIRNADKVHTSVSYKRTNGQIYFRT